MTKKTGKPVAVAAVDIAPSLKPSNYPDPFATRVSGRVKRRLGDFFGLQNFGVNLTTLAPNAISALLHRHSVQDEFIFILEGTPTLIADNNETRLKPGMCAGFPAKGVAHHLINLSETNVVYLEIGDRSSADEVCYPNDDLKAILDKNGEWTFTHKDGTPY